MNANKTKRLVGDPSRLTLWPPHASPKFPTEDDTHALDDTVPLIDQAKLDELREALDDSDLRELLGSVPVMAGKLLRQIQDAIACGDLDSVMKLSHSLKGMAGNFAAVRIAAIARSIERSADSVDTASRMTADLEHAIEETRRQFAKFG